MNVSPSVQAIVDKSGGWAKLTGAFLASQIRAADESSDQLNVVISLLAEAAKQGRLSLVTDTINAAGKTNALNFLPFFIKLKKDGSFSPLLNAIEEQLDRPTAFLLLCKATDILAATNNLQPVLECSNKAIPIGQRLIETEHGTELVRDLAGVLLRRGDAMEVLDRVDEAATCYLEAQKILVPAIESEDRLDLSDILAWAYLKEGLALLKLQRLKDALTAYEYAVSIFTPLFEQGRTELAEQLAVALRGKGLALELLEQWHEAKACREAAACIFKALGRDKL